jgi:hypothetical protein
VAHRKRAIIRRRTLTALSVLSLLLCVATLMLWVRSYWRLDVVFYRFDPGYSWSMSSALGHIDVAVNRRRAPHPQEALHPGFGTASHIASMVLTLEDLPHGLAKVGTPVSTRRFLGFGFIAYAKITGVWVPHWFLALLFAILPALHLHAAIRSRRRHRAGHCPTCGYDLRATPDRCPECGTGGALATENTENTETG